MNGRERFLRAMRFQPVDRSPSMELGLWQQTIDRWYQEGLPKDVHVGQRLDLGNEFLGLDQAGWLDIRFDPCGLPEATVLEENERYVVIRDGIGRVVKRLKAGLAKGMAASMDQRLDFPVKCREDWLALRKYYNPASPARYPAWWEDLVRCLRDRDYPLRLPGTGAAEPGLFSTLRNWMGFERACTVFYDDPAWAHEMLDSIVEHMLTTMGRALRDVEIDWFRWHEDYAFKAGPMVSPRIFREFLLPRYRCINDVLRSHRIDIIFLDSDGDIRVLLPLLIEAGVNGVLPLECAAGMDPVALRREYGHALLMQGGIDKRPLAHDKKDIEEELLSKLPPVLNEGGWIPHVDHFVPPDVSYENWLFYLDLKRRLIEGRSGSADTPRPHDLVSLRCGRSTGTLLKEYVQRSW